MIGMVSIGKSFGRLVRYVLEKERAEVLEFNGIRNLDPFIITEDFNIIRQLNPRIRNVVWHTSISFAYQDNPTPSQMAAVGKDFLSHMDLLDHQYLMVRHKDTRHQHIHILSNRIGFDGRVASDSFYKYRTVQICGSLEEKYGLTVARSQGRVRMSDKVAVKRQLKEMVHSHVSAALESGISSMDRLEEVLRKDDITVHLQRQKTGWIHGISFGYKGIMMKGSAISKAYAVGRLLRSLEANKYHDKQQENE